MNFVIDFYSDKDTCSSAISLSHESFKCLSFFIPLRQNTNVWLCDVSVVTMIPVFHQFRTWSDCEIGFIEKTWVGGGRDKILIATQTMLIYILLGFLQSLHAYLD